MDQNRSSDAKTRVLYIVESFSTGVYAIVRDIACNLDPTRFDVLILHSLRPDSPADYAKDFAFPHITLRHVPMDSPANYLRAIRIIRRTIDEYHPDAIHLHSSKAGFLGRVAAKGKGCDRIFYSPHGFAFLRTDVGAVRRRLFFRLEICADRHAHARIIAVSGGEKVHATRITGDVTVINNFIDTKAVRVANQTSNACIVTTGRIAAQKNPDMFNSIAQAFPNTEFIWVGDGPLRSHLFAPNVTVSGYVSRSQAVGYVKRAAIYLQTSLWEGMPVSVLEAMAAGKPVVASRIIGNEDLIREGETGYLCDPDDKQQFIRRIASLLADQAERARLGTTARAYVAANHDLHQAVERYMAEYRGVTCSADPRTNFPAR